MKKYNTFSVGYGQSVAGRIAFHQKMGVMRGIMREIMHHMRDIPFTDMTLVVPTTGSYTEIVEKYPSFEYNGERGYIDMLNISDNELSFHIMLIDCDNKAFTNGRWHTVREGLNLEDTCTLFEYVEDRMEQLVPLSPDNKDSFNETGALNVRILPGYY